MLCIYDSFSSHLMSVLGLLHTGCYWNPRELCREVPQVHRHGVVHFYPISSIGTDINGWVTDPHGKYWCAHTAIGRNHPGDLTDRFSMPECNSLSLSDPHGLDPFLRTLSRPHISLNAYPCQPLNCALSYSI